MPLAICTSRMRIGMPVSLSSGGGAAAASLRAFAAASSACFSARISARDFLCFGAAACAALSAFACATAAAVPCGSNTAETLSTASELTITRANGLHDAHAVDAERVGRHRVLQFRELDPLEIDEVLLERVVDRLEVRDGRVAGELELRPAGAGRRERELAGGADRALPDREVGRAVGIRLQRLQRQPGEVDVDVRREGLRHHVAGTRQLRGAIDRRSELHRQRLRQVEARIGRRHVERGQFETRHRLDGAVLVAHCRIVQRDACDRHGPGCCGFGRYCCGFAGCRGCCRRGVGRLQLAQRALAQPRGRLFNEQLIDVQRAVRHRPDVSLDAFGRDRAERYGVGRHRDLRIADDDRRHHYVILRKTLRAHGSVR